MNVAVRNHNDRAREAMRPARLSRELRLENGDYLENRRWIVGLSLFGAAIGGLVTTYQMGLVKHLPDPPVGPFDADRVEASNYAYRRMNMPDGPLMTTTYGVTTALAAAGGRKRAEETPWIPLALAAKAVYDVVTTVRLTKEEWEDNSALCPYCQAATVTTVIAAALAMPEAAKAARVLLGRSQ